MCSADIGFQSRVLAELPQRRRNPQLRAGVILGFTSLACAVGALLLAGGGQAAGWQGCVLLVAVVAALLMQRE